MGGGGGLWRALGASAHARTWGRAGVRVGGPHPPPLTAPSGLPVEPQNVWTATNDEGGEHCISGPTVAPWGPVPNEKGTAGHRRV